MQNVQKKEKRLRMHKKRLETKLNA